MELNGIRCPREIALSIGNDPAAVHGVGQIGLDVPERNMAALFADRHIASLGTEDRIEDWAMGVDDKTRGLARARVPKPRRLVEARGNNPATVRAEPRALDRAA